MTAPAGCAHWDKATRRLHINGVLVCTGCGRQSPIRFCNHVCEVKHAAEMRRLHAPMWAAALRPAVVLLVPPTLATAGAR